MSTEVLKKTRKPRAKKEQTTEEQKAPVLQVLKGERLSRYVYMDEVIKTLEIGFLCGKNVILYGPGGHGKSEMTIDFFREKGIDPFVMTMGNGTSTDRLYGGVNIKLLEETGKIEYLVENSFMNHEYVILEELFDAPDYILEQMKDILSSKQFRQGGQIFNIKTKYIVCCTNKTRDAFAKNDSLKALMERFPIETNVIWKEYNAINYEHLFKTTVGFSDPMLCFILGQYYKAGIKISPRIALTTLELLVKCGPDSLTRIAEFSQKPEILNTSIENFNNIKVINDYRVQADAIIAEIKTLDYKDSANVSKIKDNITSLEKLQVKIKNTKIDDSMVEISSTLLKSIKTVIDENKKKVEVSEKLSSLDPSL